MAEVLSDAEIADRLKTLDGRRGYVAGLEIANRMLADRVASHRWWLGSFHAEMKRLVASSAQSIRILEGWHQAVPLKERGDE